MKTPPNRLSCLCSEAELPFLIAHLSLFSENGLTRVDIAPSRSQPPILYGNLVSSVDHLEDLQGNMGLFFLFPDVSIRSRGRFQLGITLLRISNRRVPDIDDARAIDQLLVASVLMQAVS